MNLSRLVSLLGDPVADPFPVDWPAVEAWLGTPLPTDYKDLGSSFGPWYVGDWVWVEVPCADGEWHPGYTRWLPEATRAVRIRARESSVPVPALRPERGGLLAWAHTRESQVIFWDTSAEANPDEWPVVVYVDLGPVSDPWRHTGLTTLDFLAKVVSDGIPLNEFRSLGPLAPTATRTKYRLDAMPWSAPEPDDRTPEESASRRRALSEGSGLEAIRVLVPPPTDALVDERVWDEVTRQLGTRLPSDYVDLMNAYGGGAWVRDELRFPEPSDLIAFATEAADAYRELRAQFPEQFPLAVWPEPGGFLAIADTADGDYIGWLTVGNPDEWPVIVWPRHDEQKPPLAAGIVAMLLDMLRGAPVGSYPHLDVDDDPLDWATFQQFD